MGKARIILFLLFWLFVPTVQSFPSDINPSIKTVSTGPVNNYFLTNMNRFRMVTVLSEVSFSMYFEKVAYGEGHSYGKVVDKFTIEPALFKGEYRLYSASNVEWLSYNSFKFREIPIIYRIKYIDGKYTLAAH